MSTLERTKEKTGKLPRLELINVESTYYERNIKPKIYKAFRFLVKQNFNILNINVTQTSFSDEIPKNFFIVFFVDKDSRSIYKEFQLISKYETKRMSIICSVYKL
ncbi:MAG: hypothetical protein K8S87_10305 [Planctomycetes bacterium]|nr:hypothetical protein [Planctomycetota bacterium]